MRIGGIVPLSMVDYPGEPAIAIFTRGCNLRCPFCHNGELLREGEDRPLGQVFELLRKRAGELCAVCVSGGEPTVQAGLADFVCEVKSLGYKVKLDTNGSKPQVLQKLLESELLDYVAIDVKSSPDRYLKATGGKLDFETVARTVELVKEAAVAYELRTTAVPGLVELEDLLAIAGKFKPIALYAVQQFRPRKTLDPQFAKHVPYDQGWFAQAKAALAAAGTVIVRGL